MIIEFLRENWRLIVECLLLIVSIVLLCIKKRSVKVVDSFAEWLLKMIPSVVNAAESTSFKGEDKMKYVLSQLRELAVKLGIIQADNFGYYESFIRDFVELTLSTPQKKGDSNEKRI